MSYLGYVAENPSFANLALLCLSTAFQLVRIGEEERLLRSDTFVRPLSLVRATQAHSARLLSVRTD